jgi:hypothetical protein
MQRLFRWFSPLVVAAFLLVPEARAQANADPGEGTGHTASVIFSYILAILGTLLVSAILCTPSRKRSRD